MATYTELFSLNNNSDLRNRVQIACIVAAEAIMNEDGGTVNHANRLIWAKRVFENPGLEAKRMFMAIIANNADASLSLITTAPDVLIQSNVDAHIDLFADGS
jgi:hypothetical protein